MQLFFDSPSSFLVVAASCDATPTREQNHPSVRPQTIHHQPVALDIPPFWLLALPHIKFNWKMMFIQLYEELYTLSCMKKRNEKKIVVQKRDFYNVMLYISVSRCSCWIDGRAGRQTHLVSFLFSFLIHPHGAAPFSGLNWEQYVIITSGRQQLQQHH